MLVTQDMIQTIPGLNSTENIIDPLVVCKFFMPATQWTWYVLEYDGDNRFFGYVIGDFYELGYFTLSELEEVEGPYGLKVEHDLYFDPIPLSQVKRMHG
jgi:hypothetical protein